MRRRLLRADNVDAQAVDLELHQVDRLVLRQHLSRKIAVALGKRAHGALQRRLGHAAEEQYLVAQEIELLIDDPVFHARTPMASTVFSDKNVKPVWCRKNRL